MTADPTPRFVSAADLVAKWPDLFPSTHRCYQLAAAGVLPCLRRGRVVKFNVETVSRWIDAGGAPLAGGWRR